MRLGARDFLWILLICSCIQCTISKESESIIAKSPQVNAAAVLDGTNEGKTPPVAKDDTTVTPFPNVHEKIDHVEDQLHILQELEQSVAQSIDKMNREVHLDSGEPDNKRSAAERQRLSRELNAVRNNLKKLAAGLNGTLEDLIKVEKENDEQAKKLNEVLEKQKEDEQEEYLEKHGIDAVDYETGHLRNTSGMTSIQVQKLEQVEKNSDPAVLHYDFELLGQIAVLFGVAAIGGIVATYFNIPPHVGYLLGGALVGPSCLGIVRNYKEVETISLFGSIFLLFGHGAEYSLQKPDRVFQMYLLGGFAYIVTTVTLVAVVSTYIGWTSSYIQGVIIGIAVCFTTTAPLYEHIRVNQIQETSYGKTVIAIIAFQDILMSFALGTPEWFSVRSFGLISIAAFKSIVSYTLIVSLAVLLHIRIVPKLLDFLVNMEKVHHSPLILLGVVSVCLFMALLAENIGLSLECGAFFAGLAFIHSNHMKLALSSIRVLENLFGSMFFACVGMILNPIFLLKNIGEILSMVILIIVIKTVSMTGVMTFFQISMQKALLASVGLCQIGELALIFMIKAHATKLVSRRIYLLFVAATAVFLGCSTIVNRNLVLARRRTIFRLPTIVRSNATESSVSSMRIGRPSSLQAPKKQEQPSSSMSIGIFTESVQSGSIDANQDLLVSPPIRQCPTEEMMHTSPSDLSVGTRRKNYSPKLWMT